MDTIFALSSGALPAAIGVIRVSGPAAGAALLALAGALPPPRRASLRAIRDPADGQLLDRALLLWFPGPRTATGEDLAELHLHGGRAVAAGVLAALGRVAGLRPAAPGEFTRRAFANGVLDLDAAEGLADLLAAETAAERRNALALAGGALGRRVAGWQARLLAAAAAFEASFDFADEGDVEFDPTAIEHDLAVLMTEIERALAAPSSERLRDGIRLVVAGPPNSGKSTLVNALAGRDVAIVTDEAGTTRDLIEAPVERAGVALVVTDTAGLRDGAGQVEAIGIARAKEAIGAADLLLWLGAPNAAPQHARVLRVQARADIVEPLSGADLNLSVRNGTGLDELEAWIAESAALLLPQTGELALNQRQRQLLGDVATALATRASDLLLRAEDLRQAMRAFDRITGRAETEAMLDTLFSRFCIGK